MVTIQGIRIKNVEMHRDDKGKEIIKGSYDLVSSTDKVLATQDFNDYNSIKFEPTGETVKLMSDLWEAIKTDLEAQLGLSE